MTLIDQFVASWVLLFLTLLEIIGICYIYGKYNVEICVSDSRPLKSNYGKLFSYFLGGNRFIKDIEMMLGKKSCAFWLWWRACWFFLSPCIIVVSMTTHNASLTVLRVQFLEHD